MSVKLYWATLALVATVACSLCGCTAAPSAREAPAVVSVGVQSTLSRDKTHRGQGIVVGRRILSASHTFLRDGAELPSDRILLNERSVPCSVIHHGDIKAVRQLYSGQPAPASLLVEDYIAFELPFDPQIAGAPWSIHGEALRDGATLYAVRWNLGDRAPELTPLSVIEATSDEPLPGELVFVRNVASANLSGWSGCFVGRYDPKQHRWYLVGILLAGKDFPSERYHIVLRPAPSLVRWLEGP